MASCQSLPVLQILPVPSLLSVTVFTPPQVPARLRLQIPDLALPLGTEGAAHVCLPPVLRNTELVLSRRL